MNKWLYGTLMSLLLAPIGYSLATYRPPTVQCLNGIIMIPDKSGDMWVQKGLWATHCVPVDRD